MTIAVAKKKDPTMFAKVCCSEQSTFMQSLLLVIPLRLEVLTASDRYRSLV